nr:uracil-DNA glycosylase [Bacillota bacterium]
MERSWGSRLVECQLCPRLVKWRCAVAGRNPNYAADGYWSKPVNGFGDPDARLVIVGLAPGAHGANRTGRPFTGDAAGDWLYRALYEVGMASQPQAVSADDGLMLSDVFITNAVRCVPPDNKPSKEELQTCRAWLREELEQLERLQVILALGKAAFNSIKTLYREQGGNVRGMVFAHGAAYPLGEGRPVLMASYHPSRRNTNTGLLTWKMWKDVFDTIRTVYLKSS